MGKNIMNWGQALRLYPEKALVIEPVFGSGLGRHGTLTSPWPTLSVPEKYSFFARCSSA